MPIYSVSTKISSNVPPDEIIYDLCIYRMGPNRTKKILLDVRQQQLAGNYETQKHKTENTEDALSVIYMMEVMLYSKRMSGIDRLFSTPFTRMYTLQEFSTGRSWSSVKRENPCYFITTGTTHLASERPDIKTMQISRPERAFIAKEYSPESPLDPFAKKEIEKEIQERFLQKSHPAQGDTSLCGPAAFFYCLQQDRPDVYAQAARDLWQFGKTKIGELEIAPGDGCRHPSGSFYDVDGPRVYGIDWMMLAGLRDSDNAVLSYDSVSSPVAGITMWSTLTSWFEKAGYELIFSNAGATQVGIEGINKLNEYARKGYKIVTLINDGLLERGRSVLTIPTHWIVWEGAVTEDSGGSIQLQIFSWGNVYEQIKKPADIYFFLNRFFGGMVFKPLK